MDQEVLASIELSNMQKVLFIVGPTSTGKTDLALIIAKKFNGELIACDSRQVYTGLDIGTGKMPNQVVNIEKGNGYWVVGGIKIWMYDVVNPSEQYAVTRYLVDVRRVLSTIVESKKLPIFVGGTGFYAEALLKGIISASSPVNSDLRARLANLSRKELQEELRLVDAEKWHKMNKSDQENPRRLIRAIEVAKNTVVPDVEDNPVLANFDILKIGLNAAREVLYDRINQRVIERVKGGMIDEAQTLLQNGLSLSRMRELGLEYRALAELLSGEVTSQAEFVNILQGRIRGYARRQLTWFKRVQDIVWFDVSDLSINEKIEKKINFWYDQL